MRSKREAVCEGRQGGGGGWGGENVIDSHIVVYWGIFLTRLLGRC